MFRDKVNENIKTESVESFLARGGDITVVQEGKSALKKQAKKKKKKGINAQALLDAAIGTPQEQEVIAFLESQGIEVSNE